MHRILDSIWGILLPGLQPAGLPEDPAAHGALTERLAGLALVPRPGAASSPLEAGLNGTVFNFEPNPHRLTSLRFEFSRRGGAVVWHREGRKRPQRLRFGRAAWRQGSWAGAPQPNGRQLAASAAWPRPDCLEIDVCFFASPFRYTLTYEFSGRDVRAAAHVNVSFGPTDLGSTVARREAASRG